MIRKKVTVKCLSASSLCIITVKWLSAWEWGMWNFISKAYYLNGRGDTLGAVKKFEKAYRWYLSKDGWLEAKFHIDEPGRGRWRSRFPILFRCFVLKEAM